MIFQRCDLKFPILLTILLGTTYWAVFSGVKVLGQGPVVCLRIITRCTCSAPQGLLAGHKQQCSCSPSPLLWQAWVWSLQGSSGPSQKGLESHMSNDWRPSQGAMDWNDPTSTPLPGRVNGKNSALLKRSFIWGLKNSHRQPTCSIWYHDLPQYQMVPTMVPKGHTMWPRPAEQSYKLSLNICESISALRPCEDISLRLFTVWLAAQTSLQKQWSTSFNCLLPLLNLKHHLSHLSLRLSD